MERDHLDRIQTFGTFQHGSLRDPEAYFLMADVLQQLDQESATRYGGLIQRALLAFPKDRRRDLEQILGSLGACIPVDNAPPSRLAEIPHVHPAEGPALEEIRRLLQRPDKTGEAFTLAETWLADQPANVLRACREEWSDLLGLFLPKRRRILEEKYQKRIGKDEPPSPAGEAVSAEVECLDADTLEEIGTLAGSADTRLDALLWLTYLLETTPPEAGSPLADQLSRVLERFPPRDRMALTRLLPPPPPLPEEEEEDRFAREEEAWEEPVEVEREPHPLDSVADLCTRSLAQEEPTAETVAGYRLTRHALRRAAERRISKADLELVFEFGRCTHMRGAEIFILGRKEVKAHRSLSNLDALEGLHVLCSQGVVVTLFRNHSLLREGHRRRPHTR